MADATLPSVPGNPCPVCREEITHKIKLPCLHEFCFLCAKGAVMRSLKCPLCRGDVPASFFDEEDALNPENLDIATFEGSYHWYYEGRNGWWLFDVRTSEEIEAQFQEKVDHCEVSIAGFQYVIDFLNMTQFRKDAPSRTRTIKRDQAEANIKGIAGLRGNINFA